VEALSLAAHGQTTRAIAGRMAIAERTVKAHLRACRKKLGGLNTTHTVGIAVTRRLINVDTFSSGNEACEVEES
jgi:LuxR family quorum sensing-dependent transcriptional regulator